MGQFRINPSTQLEKSVSGEVYLSLGSNLGDKTANILYGISELKKIAVGKDFCASSIYFTQPWGIDDQPWFLNAVIRMTTRLKPVELLRYVEDIEREAGRTIKGGSWEARELDIDILLYGTQRIDIAGLTIPHPKMLKRRFVLEPLAELSPGLILPGVGTTVHSALESCQDQGSVIKVMVVKK